MSYNPDFFCDRCNKHKTLKQLDGFICECSGTFRVEYPYTAGRTYDAGYDPTLKCYVSSWKDAEKKAAAFRSPQHPEGFILAQDNKPFIKRCKDIVKNKEEIHAEAYAKDGMKYPKGQDTRFDEQRQCFVKKDGTAVSTKHKGKKVVTRISEKVKVAALVLITLSITSLAYAEKEWLSTIGVPFVVLTVKGVDYEVPIHKEEFTIERAKLWMEALDGDKYARKVLLGTEPQKVLFIGDGTTVRWLFLTESDEWTQTSL